MDLETDNNKTDFIRMYKDLYSNETDLVHAIKKDFENAEMTDNEAKRIAGVIINAVRKTTPPAA